MVPGETTSAAAVVNVDADADVVDAVDPVVATDAGVVVVETDGTDADVVGDIVKHEKKLDIWLWNPSDQLSSTVPEM